MIYRILQYIFILIIQLFGLNTA